MLISILISAHNGTGCLPALLDSIYAMDTGPNETEVLVRDDRSTDDTASMLRQRFPWVKLIEGKENLGFARSNNELLTEASSDVLCFLNQDTLVHRDFIKEGVNALCSNAGVAGVNTNMIMPWAMPPAEFVKTPIEELPSYEYRLARTGFVEYVRTEPSVHETNFLSGGAFFLRREALDEGEELFDPVVGAYCEDTDLSLRLRRRGAKMLYCPTAVVYHDQPPKQGASFRQIKKLLGITWNRFYVMAKHESPSSFVLHYPLYLAGIVIKMGHLGLGRRRLLIAYPAGVLSALCLLCVFPLWPLWLLRLRGRSLSKKG